MVDFHKLKNLGTDIIGRAGEFAEQAKDKVVPLAEQAKDKVGPLAEQAKDKVGPLAEQAKDRVGPLAGKAKDAAAKGVEGLDTATGRRFHDKVGQVTGNREKKPTAASADTNGAPDSSIYDSVEDAVIVEDPIPGSGRPAVDGAVEDSALGDSAVSDTAFADEGPAVHDPVIVQDSAGSPELLITTDDGSVHHPTPADMPSHHADKEPK